MASRHQGIVLNGAKGFLSNGLHERHCYISKYNNAFHEAHLVEVGHNKL